MDYTQIPRAASSEPRDLEDLTRFGPTQVNRDVGAWNGQKLIQDLLFGSPISALKLEAIFDLFLLSSDYELTRRWSPAESGQYAFDADCVNQLNAIDQQVATREHFIQTMRRAVGDRIVLSVIGEIEGLDEVNNPAIEAWVPVALFSPVQIQQRLKPPAVVATPLLNIDVANALYQASQGYPEAKRQIQEQKQLKTLRVYGEHQSEKRILEFWKALHCRLNIGDSVPHAIHVARLHLNSFGVASRPELQYSYKFFYPNELTQNLYSPASLLAQYPELKGLSALVQRELLKQLLSLYERLLPEDAAADEEKGLLEQTRRKSEAAYLAAQGETGQAGKSLLVPVLTVGAVLFLLSRR